MDRKWLEGELRADPLSKIIRQRRENERKKKWKIVVRKQEKTQS